MMLSSEDDCEATEIMGDHQDVAQREPGRWKKMTELYNNISRLEKELNDLALKDEELTAVHEEVHQELEAVKEEFQEKTEEMGNDEDEKVDLSTLEKLQAIVDEKSQSVSKASLDLESWRAINKVKIESLNSASQGLQRKLKSICATVRNEYSKVCLQEDFRNGLKELLRGDDDDENTKNVSNGHEMPLTDGFVMPVYCISANDYLKIEGIKPSTDGPPSCFERSEDTQIPDLRGFVHQTTAHFRVSFAKAFVEQANDLLERVKLIAAGSNNVPGGRTSRRCLSVFESAVDRRQTQIKSIADEFQRRADSKVQSTLYPSLQSGAAKGQAAAVSAVSSWGSKNRRSRNEQRPDKNGLWYATYQATLRRGGEYVSGSAGEINFGMELCAPMEKEFRYVSSCSMAGTLNCR